MFVPSLLPSSRFSGTAVAARARIWVRPLQAIGQAYFLKCQFDEAAAKLLLSKTIEAFPGHTPFSPCAVTQPNRRRRPRDPGSKRRRAAGRTDGRIRGTGGSNPSPSSGESANHRFLNGGGHADTQLLSPTSPDRSS